MNDVLARVCETNAEVLMLTPEKVSVTGGGALRAGVFVKHAFIRGELLCTRTARMACRLLDVSPRDHY